MKATFVVVRTDTEEVSGRWYSEAHSTRDVGVRYRSWLVIAEPELPEVDEEMNVDPVDDVLYEVALNGMPQDFTIHNQTTLGGDGLAAGRGIEISTGEKIPVGAIVTIELKVSYAP